MARKITSRATAIARKLPHYFTGKPCKRGHVCERRVNGYVCVVCSREKAAKHKRTPKGRETSRRYKISPKGRQAQRRRRLDRALDTTRDDYDPVRAARLLAKWNASH